MELFGRLVEIISASWVDGTTIDRNHPVQVVDSNGEPFDEVIAISAGGHNTVLLKSDGSVWCVGANGGGQLGEWNINRKSCPRTACR